MPSSAVLSAALFVPLKIACRFDTLFHLRRDWLAGCCILSPSRDRNIALHLQEFTEGFGLGAAYGDFGGTLVGHFQHVA